MNILLFLASKIKGNTKIKEKVTKIKGGNVSNGLIKPADLSQIAKDLKEKMKPVKMNVNMTHTNPGYSQAQILAKKDDSKVNKIYSTKPDVPIQFIRDTIKGYSPDEAENGLEAADKGLATTLTGGFTIMNNSIREPNFYDKVVMKDTVLPSGYKAAYMINSLKKRISPELQSPEELKVKRK